MSLPQIAVGRRKTSVARVRLIEGTGKVVVNGRTFEDYFPIELHRKDILRPFAATENIGKYDVFANVEGGGVSGQVGAVRLGIARSLVAKDEEYRSALRKDGLLTRDPRMVERKKYGFKKARKRFQWTKR